LYEKKPSLEALFSFEAIPFLEALSMSLTDFENGGAYDT
jgi:hypothetical protein